MKFSIFICVFFYVIAAFGDEAKEHEACQKEVDTICKEMGIQLCLDKKLLSAKCQEHYASMVNMGKQAPSDCMSLVKACPIGEIKQDNLTELIKNHSVCIKEQLKKTNKKCLNYIDSMVKKSVKGSKNLNPLSR